ncbi:PH domain-containing protein [Agrococcus sp. HG114]|uniref:PH domain-containing protein n=1 Tax=Agrococcus sp. HG114 TaxID=2969757 RepID=UPI00215B384A|nr:PH domain-containing protein [Agrococcus sp. HG114]MCR8670200.1 PH domain-containing protein [Agrococcus sp. HG114]
MFRSSFGRVITIVIAVLMGLALVSALLADDPLANLWVLPWPLLGAAVTWAFMWRPRVTVDAEGIEIRNPFTDWHVPWGAVKRIDTKWALELTLDRGTVTAWAAPAPSRYGIARITREDIRLARESSTVGGAIRPGDSVHSVSGAAAHVTRTHWEELRDEGLLDDRETATRAWHLPAIAAVATTAVLAAAGLLLR